MASDKSDTPNSNKNNWSHSTTSNGTGMVKTLMPRETLMIDTPATRAMALAVPKGRNRTAAHKRNGMGA